MMGVSKSNVKMPHEIPTASIAPRYSLVLVCDDDDLAILIFRSHEIPLELVVFFVAGNDRSNDVTNRRCVLSSYAIEMAECRLTNMPYGNLTLSPGTALVTVVARARHSSQSSI